MGPTMVGAGDGLSFSRLMGINIGGRTYATIESRVARSRTTYQVNAQGGSRNRNVLCSIYIAIAHGKGIEEGEGW